MNKNTAVLSIIFLLAAVVVLTPAARGEFPSDYISIGVRSEVSGDLVLNQTERLSWTDTNGTVITDEWRNGQDTRAPISFGGFSSFDLAAVNGTGYFTFRHTGTDGIRSSGGSWSASAVPETPSWYGQETVIPDFFTRPGSIRFPVAPSAGWSPFAF